MLFQVQEPMGDFVVINRVRNRGFGELIKDYHSLFYHGIPDRDDKIVGSRMRNYTLTDELREPLLLRKNVHGLRGVLMPSLNLVISEEVRAAVGDLPNVVFKKVEFEQLFEYPYGEGDFSFELQLDYRGGIADAPVRAIRALGNDPQLKDRVGAYFEVIVHLYRNIASRFRSLAQREANVPEAIESTKLRLKISESMLDQYPVFDTGGHGIVVKTQVARILQQFSNPTYLDFRSPKS